MDQLHARHKPVLTVNVWGHLSGGFGLGEGARCTIRSLRTAGVRVRTHDLRITSHPNDQTIAPEAATGVAAIDIVHTNPNILRQSDGLREQLKLNAPLRIGFWAWELEDFPTGWELEMGNLDQLWCPSSFTATSLGLRSPIPVTPLPHLIDWRRAEHTYHMRQTRKRLETQTLFTILYCFDAWSTIGRKNPMGAIETFQRAFPQKKQARTSLPEARLILKMASAEQFPQERELLRQRADSDKRIKLIEKHLASAEMDKLLARADLLIHLHRAEGFGLMMAEAMACGLPVLATGYSGNLDFMPIGSAALVSAKRVRIEKTEGDYRAGWHWAEPDLDDAAAQLRALAQNLEQRQRLGEAGRHAARDLLHPQRVAAIARQRLGCLLAQAGRGELIRALGDNHPLRRLET